MITLVIVGILAERMCLIDQYYLRSFVKQNQLMKMQMRASLKPILVIKNVSFTDDRFGFDLILGTC